jgi:farnesyl diphosphate synthase
MTLWLITQPLVIFETRFSPLLSNSFTVALRTIAAETEASLQALLPPHGTRVADAMRYACLGQGKRLRPFLVLQSAALHDADREQALRVGAALECIHCYSLVHDDLPAMDDDDLRRGQPTVHRKFDEATAILAGDALQTLAFEILASPLTHRSAEVRTRLVSALAVGSGEQGMVGGQMLDILAETAGFSSIAEISAMQAKKTGALFRFACEAGPIMAEADPAPLREYAAHFGVAFQIADDILDVESSPEALGKATQKDKSKGKATFVDLLGLAEAKAEALRLVDAAIAALDPYGDKANLLRDAARFSVIRQK